MNFDLKQEEVPGVAILFAATAAAVAVCFQYFDFNILEISEIIWIKFINLIINTLIKQFNLII